MTVKLIIARWTAALVALALSSAGSASFAASATQHKPRRASPPPAPASREIEPETTGTIAAKPPARLPDLPVAAPKPEDEALPTPFRLPSASRARMRDCGRKWQAMKMSGEAGDDIWRDFATRCLATASGPYDKR